MRSNPPKIHVGQTLYVRDTRYRTSQLELQGRDGTVTKIGRKYFTVTWTCGLTIEERFHREDWRQVSNYVPDYELFLSEQEYLDSITRNKYNHLLYKTFQTTRNKFTLDELRNACTALGIDIDDRDNL